MGVSRFKPGHRSAPPARNEHGEIDRFELDDMIVAKISEAMGRRWSKSTMTAMICEYAGKKLGKKGRGGYYHLPSRATTEKIFTMAREDLTKRLDLDTRWHKGMAIEFYESVIRDPLSTNTERIRAQERIDNVLGIDAKFGQQSEAADATASKMRKALEAINKITSGVTEDPDAQG